MTNCTIVDNYAGENGAGLVLDDSDVTIVDSIFWGNWPYEIRSRGTTRPSIRYCCVRDWWPDIGNIYSNPLFARPGRWIDPKDPNVVLEPEQSARRLDGRRLPCEISGRPVGPGDAIVARG